MLQDEYAAFLSGRDWLVQGRGVFGVWGGLPFQVNFAPSGRGAAAFLFRHCPEPAKTGDFAIGFPQKAGSRRSSIRRQNQNTVFKKFFFPGGIHRFKIFPQEGNIRGFHGGLLP